MVGSRPSNHVKTTILPPALFSSMQRCASTMSTSLNTLPTWTRNVPAATCPTNSSSGVSMKSSGPPSSVVRHTEVGITSIGLKSSNDHLLPTIPVMQTMPRCLAQRSESLSVVVPLSSRTLSAPLGKTSFTCSAMAPVSMKIWSAPPERSSCSRSGLRVVDATTAPWFLAIDAAASPTDVVPPRISKRSPLPRRSDLNTEPHAVCSISGIAPKVSQGRPVLITCTCVTGTQVYSAYPPSKLRPIPPMGGDDVALGELRSRSLLDQADCLDAEDPRKDDARRKTLPSEQLGSVQSERLDPDENLSCRRRRDRAALDLQDFRPTLLVDNRSLHGVHTKLPLNCDVMAQLTGCASGNSRVPSRISGRGRKRRTV